MPIRAWHGCCLMNTRKTLVGSIDQRVLDFTAGRDIELDLQIAEADCLGTAAHVTMLSRLKPKPPISPAQQKRVVKELITIIREVRAGKFRIRTSDQDIHMAVERVLTKKLGETGKRVHTARSRNDQVATALRLHGKSALLTIMESSLTLATVLVKIAGKQAAVPMVGRTHQQPAMPSSVGLWASAHAESLLDDMTVLSASCIVNNRCPLGSGAGYGVPIQVDRALTARLLDFEEPHLNVLYASNARGKCEAVILNAVAQIMLTCGRLAQDITLYTMPEFDYFTLSPEFCTGSSIMPQKQNPDVAELVRARATAVCGYASTVTQIMNDLPGGYQRDLQETKAPYLVGLQTTLACLDILGPMLEDMKVNKKKLLAGFTPGVFATGKAMELVSGGMPFRDAYDHVKRNIDDLDLIDPAKTVPGGESGGAAPDLAEFRKRISEVLRGVRSERNAYHRAMTQLLGLKYPELG